MDFAARAPFTALCMVAAWLALMGGCSLDHFAGCDSLLPLVAAYDCGSNADSARCKAACCSSFGYCGTTDAYCGLDCQPAFGCAYGLLRGAKTSHLFASLSPPPAGHPLLRVNPH